MASRNADFRGELVNESYSFSVFGNDPDCYFVRSTRTDIKEPAPNWVKFDEAVFPVAQGPLLSP